MASPRCSSLLADANASAELLDERGRVGRRHQLMPFPLDHVSTAPSACGTSPADEQYEHRPEAQRRTCRRTSRAKTPGQIPGLTSAARCRLRATRVAAGLSLPVSARPSKRTISALRNPEGGHSRLIRRALRARRRATRAAATLFGNADSARQKAGSLTVKRASAAGSAERARPPSCLHHTAGMDGFPRPRRPVRCSRRSSSAPQSLRPGECKQSAAARRPRPPAPRVAT